MRKKTLMIDFKMEVEIASRDSLELDERISNDADDNEMNEDNGVEDKSQNSFRKRRLSNKRKLASWDSLNCLNREPSHDVQLCLLLLFDQVKNTQKLKRYEPKCPTKNQSTLPFCIKFKKADKSELCCFHSLSSSVHLLTSHSFVD